MAGIGLLERLLIPRAADANDERMWTGGGAQSRAGVNVSADTALTYSAFYACVAVIAEDESTLPLPAFQKAADGRRIPRPDHQVHYLFNVRPNERQTAQEFREWMTAVCAMRGEALARIVSGARGFADQLMPMDPNRTTKQTLPSGEIRYQYRDDANRQLTLLPDDVFRLPGRMGLSVVTLARETIGAAIAGDRFTSSMWAKGVKPRMGLQHPGKLSKDAADRIRDSVDAEHAGADNAGRSMVFEEGMTWVKVGIDPKDAQFLESRQFSVEEMCRWFRMQPHKVAHLLRSTNNNIEHQGIEHVTDTMRPWCVRWEQASGAQLILEPDVYVKHNLDALLRGDATSRAQALEIQRRNGVRNANEWRELEDLDPRDDPGGDTYWDVQPGTGSGGSDPGGKQPSKARALAVAAAGRVVQREVSAITRKAAKHASADPARDPEGWAAWEAEVNAFYVEHRAHVAESLNLSTFLAASYCDEKAREVLADGVGTVARWAERDTRELADLALGGAE